MMKKELQKFKNVENIKDEMIERRENLERRMRKLLDMQNNVQNDLRDTKANFKRRKAELQKHEAYLGFSDLENKVS